MNNINYPNSGDARAFTQLQQQQQRMLMQTEQSQRSMAQGTAAGRPFTINNNINANIETVAAMTVGRERYKSDLRQYAGFLFVLSIAVTTSPLSTILSNTRNATLHVAVSSSNNNDALFTLCSALCECLVGIVGTFVSSLELFTNTGNRYLTLFLLITIQLGWVPLILSILDVVYAIISAYGVITPSSNNGAGGTGGVSGWSAGGGGINSTTNITNAALDNPFIPSIYEPTAKDVTFIGVMTCLSIIIYTFTLLGSMAYLSFSIFTFQVHKPEKRNASYHRSRSWFYDGLVVFGGFAQMATGAYVLSRFGLGPMIQQNPIQCGMFIIYWPEVTLALGIGQCIYGLLGYFRASSIRKYRKDSWYHVMGFSVWLAMIILQLMFQFGWEKLPDVGSSTSSSLTMSRWGAKAQSLACAYVGFAFIPAFLDAKIDNTPERIKPNYYYCGDSAYDVYDNGAVPQYYSGGRPTSLSGSSRYGAPSHLLYGDPNHDVSTRGERSEMMFSSRDDADAGV